VGAPNSRAVSHMGGTTCMGDGNGSGARGCLTRIEHRDLFEVHP
jgi:hypothetical protein